MVNIQLRDFYAQLSSQETSFGQIDELNVITDKIPKFGICCAGCEEKHFTPLTRISNWTYNYRLYPKEPFPLSWAQENKVEFVPMIKGRWNIELPDGSECTLAYKEGQKKCDVDELVDVLNKTGE